MRDGVLLCTLLNQIQPGSISWEKLVRKPHLSQVLCERNIGMFLECCRNKFGIHPDDCFEPYMLFEYADTGKVILMLSKLSETKLSLQTGVPSFPMVHIDRRVILDTYHPTKDITDDNNYGLFSISDAKVTQEEKIYEEIQKIYCTHDSMKLMSRKITVKKSEKVVLVASQLYDSENGFLNVLENLLNVYREDLKRKMSPDDLDLVFFKIPELYQIHKEFLEDLSTYFEAFMEISEVFMKYEKKFLVYADFCANLHHAQEKIKDMTEQNPSFKKYLDMVRLRIKGSFSLHDLLTTPFERFLKYKFFIQDMIKSLPQTDPEHAALQDEEMKLVVLAEHCNESKRDRESLDQLERIQELIDKFESIFSTPLSHYGRLIKEDKVQCTFPTGKTKYVNLLLQDINILIFELSQGMQVYNNGYLLSEIKLDHANLQKKKKQFTFIANCNTPNSKSYTITLKTTENRDEWRKLISEAQKKLVPEHHKHGNHDFLLHTFPEVTFCSVCGIILKGFINQGYKCSRNACGVAIHLGCILRCQPCRKNIGKIKPELSRPWKPDFHNVADRPPQDQGRPWKKDFPKIAEGPPVPVKPVPARPWQHEVHNVADKPPEQAPAWKPGYPNMAERPSVPVKPEQAPAWKPGYPNTVERPSVPVKPEQAPAWKPGYPNIAERPSVPVKLDQNVWKNEFHNIAERLPAPVPSSDPQPKRPVLVLKKIPHVLEEGRDNSKPIFENKNQRPLDFIGEIKQRHERKERNHDHTEEDNRFNRSRHENFPPKVFFPPKPELCPENFRHRAASHDNFSPTPYEKEDIHEAGINRNNQMETYDTFENPSSPFGQKLLMPPAPAPPGSVQQQASPDPTFDLTMTSLQCFGMPNDIEKRRNERESRTIFPAEIPGSNNLPEAPGYEIFRGAQAWNQAANARPYRRGPSVSEQTQGWVGECDSQEATRLLTGKLDGTYIVRQRSDGSLAISVRFQGSVRHIAVDQLNNGQVCLMAEFAFDTMRELLLFYSKNKLSDIYQNLDVCLTKPYRKIHQLP